VTGDAVDVIRRRLVHRLHHTNTEVFSCNLWKAESETICLPNSPRATPFTIEIQEEQPIQPIKKQEKGEKQILNGQSFVSEAASGNNQPASANTSHLPKKR
jgi:hypothetical protein